MIVLVRKRDKLSKHNRRIIITTVVIIAFSALTLITGRAPSSLENMFKDSVAYVEYYLIKKPAKIISDVFYEYTHLKNAYDENTILKQELENYAREAALNETLSLEINQLKELLAIDFIPSDYNVKYTSVLSRDIQNWSNKVTLNMGESSGVKEGMAVISSKGMIGTVSHVTEVTSTVSLLSDENPLIQIPVMILCGGEEYYGLLTKYDLSSKCYRISLLSDVEKIDENATVVTSGLGGEGKTPKGILIGNVTSFTVKNDTTEAACLVKPSADFEKLNYVAIVQRVN